MKDKLKIDIPIIVEGRYDKAHLTNIVSGQIITTDGFGIFKAKEKKEFITKLSQKSGIIVLTDSDGAGLVIRNYIKSILPPQLIHNIYIPQIEGKERRKLSPSKEGYLGVEGVDIDKLHELLEPFATEQYVVSDNSYPELTKAVLYSDGYFGVGRSSEKRKKLLSYLLLPDNLSSNALIEAINSLGLYGQYREFTESENNADND